MRHNTITCNECGKVENEPVYLWFELDVIAAYKSRIDEQHSIEWPLHFCSLDCLVKYTQEKLYKWKEKITEYRWPYF